MRDAGLVVRDEAATRAALGAVDLHEDAEGLDLLDLARDDRVHRNGRFLDDRACRRRPRRASTSAMRFFSLSTEFARDEQLLPD